MDAALLKDPAFWTSGEWFAPAGFPGRMPAADDFPGQVLFETSGSSGRPKWIALSRGALLVSAAAVNRHLRVSGDSRWGLALPLHHVGGFGVMARAFESGCGWSRLESKWSAEACSAWLEETGVTHLSLVPTQVHDLAVAGVKAAGTLEAIVVGGGRLEPEAGRRARELGWPVLASYGMTEAGSQIATQSPEVLDAPYEAGEIPLLPIWDAAVDATGRLSIAGPALFTGMVEQAAGGWEFHPRRGGWHETADRVLLRERRLTPVGRADLLVKVLGELVSPEAIERRLGEIAGGRLAAGGCVVTALPCERKGNRLVPVFEMPVEEGFVTSLLENYNAGAAGYLRLEKPVFLEAFPRSELGKPRRGALSEEAGRRLAGFP